MRPLILAAAGFLATAASAIPPSPSPGPPAPPPRLLIVISVDQLSGDLFDEYRPHFSGGLARLARGVVFRNGYQAHAATETCPGHSTILTGSHPARTGIVGNNWVDQSVARTDKRIYCAEDERVPRPAGTAAGTAGSYTVSPWHLKVATLGDLLKQRSPASRNVAVGGKDRSAVMMGGRLIDQRWYWDGKAFATDLAAAPVPQTVTRANAAVAASIAAGREPLDPPAICQGKSTPLTLAPNLTVGNGRFARPAGDSRAFRASPEFDGAMLALAAGLIQELKLGSDAAPDVLSVGLAATDYVGHAFGSGGGEMCLQLLSLDRDLGDFFSLLDRQGTDYAVVLTADHGALDIPERLRARGVAGAAWADVALATGEVGKRIAAKLGISGPALLGELAGEVYVDRTLKSADRSRVLDEALAYYRAHPQVAAVFTSAQLASTAIPTGSPDRWSLLQRARASFDPQRSGDLVVILKQHVMPIATAGAGYVSTHGSAWDYDRRVPIAFWRPGTNPAERSEAVSTVDILPTLAAMLGIAAPAGIDGKCLRGIQGIACQVR